MIDYTTPIAIALLINLFFQVLIFIIGKVFSNQLMLRYVDLGIKEFIIILIFVIFTFYLYNFIYNEELPYPEFVLSAFYGSSINPGSVAGYLQSNSIYNMSKEYVRYLLSRINNLSYMFIEIEGRLYHLSSYTCSRCASEFTVLGFDIGCSFFPNSLSIYTIIPYINYVEPVAQSLATARNSLELSTKILSSYYGLLNLGSTKAIIILMAYGIILRLIPGMKFAGNTLMAISFVILIILPIVVYLQSNIFYKYINTDVNNYYNKIEQFFRAMPGYLYPDFIKEVFISLSNIILDPADPCKNLISTPYITLENNDIKYTINLQGSFLNIIFPRQGVSLFDSEIKRAHQSLFIVSTFSLSTTVVAMIIAAKSIVMLLGERFSFLDLFLRVI